MIKAVKQAVEKLNKVKFLDRADWRDKGWWGIQAGEAGPALCGESAIRIARSYELEEELARIRLRAQNVVDQCVRGHGQAAEEFVYELAGV